MQQTYQMHTENREQPTALLFHNMEHWLSPAVTLWSLTNIEQLQNIPVSILHSEQHYQIKFFQLSWCRLSRLKTIMKKMSGLQAKIETLAHRLQFFTTRKKKLCGEKYNTT